MQHNLPIHRIAEETVNRNSINAVAISFLITMLPHFAHLPLWVTVLALLSLGWRSLQAFGFLFTLPRWLLITMVVAGGIGVFAQFWTIAGRDAGLALLTVMTAFKFLETNTHRDILILIFLSYFLLATHFLFDQSILIALFMFACLIIITTTLITINQRDDSIMLKDRLGIASKLIGLSIPLMIILFILVPRIPGPIWGLSHEQRGGITGLSEDMTPGSISDLITSNEVAFRVNFEGEIPPQDQLYWRGPVMTNFDGRRWSQTKHRKLTRLDVIANSELRKYTITLEPNGKNWLLGLDIPNQIIPDSYISSEYQLISNKPINDLKRYSLSSILDYRMSVNESFGYLVKANAVNENRNPKTLALGRQWATQFNSDEQIIQQALNMFRQQEYIYTLQPPLLGTDPSDEFLFDTRRGFCEHYASSFALLMRAADIPARVVTGYQGGEINEVGNYLIVRQSDAHAWTEVWLDDRGWIRVDPTAAVSPDRIEGGLDQALNDELANFKFSKRSVLLSKLLFNLDNMQHRWNDWILNYDHKKQSRFLRNLGVGIQSWGDMVIALVIGLIAMSGAYWLVTWYRDKPAPPAEFEKIIKKLLRKLERSGFTKLPSEQPTEFLERIQREHQFKDQKLEKIFVAYNRIKYAAGYQKESIINRFKQLAEQWTPSTQIKKAYPKR